MNLGEDNYNQIFMEAEEKYQEQLARIKKFKNEAIGSVVMFFLLFEIVGIHKILRMNAVFILFGMFFTVLYAIGVCINKGKYQQEFKWKSYNTFGILVTLMIILASIF